MAQHSTWGVRRGSRRAGTVLAGVMASGAVAVAAGLGSAPTANATCVSFWGIGNGGGCTSHLFSAAIAIGTGATATADGLFGNAFAIGNGAIALSTGALNLAYAGGEGAYARTLGTLEFAAAQGKNSSAYAGTVSSDLGNTAINIGTADAFGNNQVAAGKGIGNLAVNLFGHGSAANPSVVDGLGFLNLATNLFGNGNHVVAVGVLNNAANLAGDNNTIAAGDIPTPSATVSLAFNVFGSGNGVFAGPGPLAVAGAIAQTGKDGPNAIKKAGPGFNINGFVVGGAAAVHPAASAATNASHSKR